MSLSSRSTALAVLGLLFLQGLPALSADRPVVWIGTNDPVASTGPAATNAIGGRQDRAWPAAIGENFGSPMFFDLTGDGRMEIITTDRSNTYVFDASGALLPGWPRTGGSDNIPAVADIDEDGSPEILIASPGAPPRLRCFNVDGSAQAGFPVSLPYQNWLNVTAPAIADVDGDGHLDVGAQTEPGVAFVDRFGQPLPGWPYLWSTTQNIAWSAPAVADLDGDDAMEVVVGNNILYGCTVHVIRADGTLMPGWPQPANNLFSSVAVGDLDGDGDLEIVIQEGDPTWYGNLMHVWHHDGTHMAGWPREICAQWESSRSNPAIADVDGNGSMEIVTQSGDSMLHIFRSDGTEFPGYPRALPSSGAISSVQVLDTNADGVEEFFLCYYAGSSQWVSGWTLGGQTLAGFPKLLYSGSQLDAHSSAHLADLEADGDLDLCAQGGTFGAGKVWVYEVTGSTFNPAWSRADWPKIRHDVRNTGYFPQRDPAEVTGSVVSLEAIQVVPNPVQAEAAIRLSWGAVEPIRLEVFDVGGERVRMILDGAHLSGEHAFEWDGRDDRGHLVPSGSYLIRAAGSARTASRRVTLLR